MNKEKSAPTGAPSVSAAGPAPEESERQGRDAHAEFIYRPNYLVKLLHKWYRDAMEEVAAKDRVIEETTAKHHEEMKEKDEEISRLTAQIATVNLALEERTRELEEANQTIDILNSSLAEEKNVYVTKITNVAANKALAETENVSLSDSTSHIAKVNLALEERTREQEAVKLTVDRLHGYTAEKQNVKNTAVNEDPSKNDDPTQLVSRIIKTCDDWTTRFSELVAYKYMHGHCDASSNDEGDNGLGYWVEDMREEFKSGRLSDERVAKLNDLGFIWRPKLRLDWTARFRELVAYKRMYGNCCVPRKEGEHKSLGNWVMRVRQDFKKGKLSEERIAKLNGIGFVWKQLGDYKAPTGWATRYYELVAYKRMYGHCNISSNDQVHRDLACWVSRVRQAFKDGRIPEERIAKLNDIGFVWA